MLGEDVRSSAGGVALQKRHTWKLSGCAFCPHCACALQVLVDIGGIADLATVMHLVGLYYRTWRGAVIIVKSVFFARLLGDAGEPMIL